MSEGGRVGRRLGARVRFLLPAGLLALHVTLLALSVSRKAATVDEFVHLPAGVYYWQTGDFSLSGLNPPLAKLWTALPVLPMEPLMPIAAEPSFRDAAYPWTFGLVYLNKNWDRYEAMFTRARAMVMALSALTALAMFLWARRAIGFWPAALALALYAVEPNILAHGRLATQDTAMMLALVVVLAALDGLLERGGWGRVAALGVALGAACLVKYSGLILAMALPLALAGCVAFVRGFRLPLAVPGEKRFREGRRRAAWQSFVALVAVALVTLLVVNGAYGFRGTFRLPHAATKTSPARALWLLPDAYVDGLEGQRAAATQGETANYLNRTWSERGWWYYYLEAFALKLPIPVLVLALAGLVSVFVVRPERKATAILALVTGVLFWAVHSFGANKQLGIRYLLPLFPLVSMLAGRSAVIVSRLAGLRRKALLVALALLVCWAAADALWIHPHYLAFFNAFAGGPEGGPRYLLDSNIDWGQDLPGLADYLRREKITGDVYLGYFGCVPPGFYGIHPRLPYPGVRGCVAVSVNYLYGMPFTPGVRDYFRWLRARKPDAVIGHTIYVYRTDRE